jgi:tRNA(fMet)-specific endonuclease VapC
LYLLDTNIVGYLLSGRSAVARARYAKMGEEADFAISALTEAEVRFGCERKPAATRLHLEVEGFLSSLNILAWDSAAAQSYAKLRVYMQSLGRTLEAMDMLIAAHALSVGAVLVTRDKGFAGVAGFLQTENWATDVL